MKNYSWISIVITLFLTNCINNNDLFVNAKEITITTNLKEQTEFFKCFAKYSKLKRLICYADTWKEFHEENIPKNNNDSAIHELSSEIPIAYHKFFAKSESQSHLGGQALIKLSGYSCQGNLEARELFFTKGYKLNCNNSNYLLLEKENSSWLIKKIK